MPDLAFHISDLPSALVGEIKAAAASRARADYEEHYADAIEDERAIPSINEYVEQQQTAAVKMLKALYNAAIIAELSNPEAYARTQLTARGMI